MVTARAFLVPNASSMWNNRLELISYTQRGTNNCATATKCNIYLCRKALYTRIELYEIIEFPNFMHIYITIIIFFKYVFIKSKFGNIDFKSDTPEEDDWNAMGQSSTRQNIYNVFRLRLLIYIYKKIRLDFSIVVANRYKFSDIVQFIAFAKCAFLLNIYICVCKEFGH